LGIISVCYLFLLIPFESKHEPVLAARKPFIWNRDPYWNALEQQFNAARQEPLALESKIDNGLTKADFLLMILQTEKFSPQSPIIDSLESVIFQIGPELAARPGRLPDYKHIIYESRRLLKIESRNWDMNSQATRHSLYRLLYGGRAAVEEVMLQSSPDSMAEIELITDEPSQTPCAKLRGQTIHSGDILVSRGGAATSALIARGNDYPGNFSHVALAYVDSATGKLSILEAHIEKGVTISEPEQYLSDTKLRIMILRLRYDLLQLVSDPLIPHKAARSMYDRARKGHIAYDFEMDFADPSKLFCSEVASSAYRNVGITLWMGISSISSKGIASWLSAFGVRHFETQEPADLEYDPQLTVVAEWRDPATLYKDHLDNALIDAMLERAERGEELKYNCFLLPFGRIAKAYSAILNLFGKFGPIPEGMSTEAALRNKRFSAAHAKSKEILITLADKFEKDNGYRPPYWELVKLAGIAVKKEATFYTIQ
jgi:hypothetical protein